jgi:hypothetical protein
MSQWMTSGSKRLKERQNHTFAQRAQRRAKIVAPEQMRVSSSAVVVASLSTNVYNDETKRQMKRPPSNENYNYEIISGEQGEKEMKQKTGKGSFLVHLSSCGYSSHALIFSFLKLILNNSQSQIFKEQSYTKTRESSDSSNAMFRISNRRKQAISAAATTSTKPAATKTTSTAGLLRF